MSLALPKSMRLGGAMAVQQLHREGKHFVAWPLRVTYLPMTEEIEGQNVTQIVVWAPKRLFKHAVDRNRLKRLMREAWRLNQNKLQGTYQIAFDYIDPHLQTFQTIEKAVCKAIKKIAEK